MREILFRAKRVDNGEWVYGYYTNIAKINHFIVTGKLSLDASSKEYFALEMYPIDIKTLCQFTGLCDKNGTKIFNRDIIKNIDDDDNICGVGEVIFLLGCWYVCGDIQNELYCINRIHDLKVIGNTLDNPELLGGGE